MYSKECLFFCNGKSSSQVPSTTKCVASISKGCFPSGVTYYLAVYLTKKALIPIETAWNNQAKFIQDASHELRTPISIISSK